MSVNWRQSEVCIVTNDKSQGSIAKRLSWDGLFYYKFITLYLLMKDFFNRRTYGEVTSKMVDCVIFPIRLTVLSSKMQNLPDK